jgi:hypothetical protein
VDKTSVTQVVVAEGTVAILKGNAARSLGAMGCCGAPQALQNGTPDLIGIQSLPWWIRAERVII